MSNLHVVRKIQEIYDPKTAFGNKELIELIGEFVVPDEEGYYKVEGNVEEIIRYDMSWECPNCGYNNEEEDTSKEEGELSDEECDNCEAKCHVQF